MNMCFQKGVYEKKVEGVIFQYTILKVMPKTLDLEMRFFNSDRTPYGESWFSYRFPKERLVLDGYKKVKDH